MFAQLRQARDLLPQPLRADKDAEGRLRQHAEVVRLTTNKWRTCWEFSDEQLLSVMGCEWFARLVAAVAREGTTRRRVATALDIGEW